jgi:hypothetical protein
MNSGLWNEIAGRRSGSGGGVMGDGQGWVWVWVWGWGWGWGNSLRIPRTPAAV